MAIGIGGFDNFTINTGNTGTTLQSSMELTKKIRSEDAESEIRSKTGSDGADRAKAAAAGSGLVTDADSYISSNPKGKVYQMSEEERANLVASLKDEQESIQKDFLRNMVSKDILTQAGAFNNATGAGLASLFEPGALANIDKETKQNAINAISEDGYYGVKQTSQRIFDFVSGIAGDNEELMRSYQEAVEDGFSKAAGIWGKELPEISGNTHAAVNKLFDDYYNEKAAQSAIAGA